MTSKNCFHFCFFCVNSKFRQCVIENISIIKNQEKLKTLEHELIEEFERIFIVGKTLSKVEDEKLIRQEKNNYTSFKFLDENFILDFCKDDEILVHQFFLHKFRIVHFPLLSRWVRKSKNINFKVFIIKEIAFFNQRACASILSSLLDLEQHKNVQLAIIDTLRKMYYQQGESQIIACYEGGCLEVKRAVIEAISDFKSNLGMEFLNQQFFKCSDSEIKTDIINAMKCIREEKFESINGRYKISDNSRNETIDPLKYHFG